MNIDTGREFSFPNPQDDPHLYPQPPLGFNYNYNSHLIGIPYDKSNENDNSPIPSNQNREKLLEKILEDFEPDGHRGLIRKK